MTFFLVSFVFLLLSFQITQAQVIKGRLLDVETDSAVSFANIYFNAAYKGTSSGSKGYFELKIGDFQDQAIVFSSVGYETLLLEEYQAGEFYKIYLKPKETVLGSIVVEPDDLPRAIKEKMFKEHFLGLSKNGLSCVISNLNDIRLVYFKSSQTLEAYCEQPILIKNASFAYNLTYFLDAFTYSKGYLRYQGNFFFENDTTIGKSSFRKALRMRRLTYTGSTMHFFRSLWSNSLADNKFALFSARQRPLDYAGVVVENNGEKFLLGDNNYILIHKKVFTTRIQMKKPKAFFDKTGLFDPGAVLWSGYLSQERIGDQLPLDFELEK